MPNFPAVPEFPRPLSSPRNRNKDDNCCSRTERCCCAVATWLPISIVYGATAWAIYVNGYLISISFISGVLGWSLAVVSLLLYGLCIWSYSVAVFTDPLSPIDADNGYSYLPQWTPSTDPTLPPALTVKNDGRARYCQKCNYTKPDRTHHCSICRRCILKMDHHCPWLGNCIGFANYKPFVLFLVYLTLFCAVCCASCGVSLSYWAKFVSPNADYLPVQWILLAVISGVVALCVGGFSIWHIMHVLQNITTIEALEKSRYIHTFPSPQNNYNAHPPSHPRRRRSSNDVPNAFDIGQRKNWEQVMGENPWLWCVPVMNSLGNGLSFPVSEDVRGILRGMRGAGQTGPFLGGVVEEEDESGEDGDEEEGRVYRRDTEGRWMMHD